MIVGNTSKGDDLDVNPSKEKVMSNYRMGGVKDDSIILTPPWTLTIERGLEIMKDDEYLEITPKTIRLRKQFLKKSDRDKSRK